MFTDFPPQDLLDSLVELYFRNVNDVTPLLHEPTFRKDVAEGLHCRRGEFGAIVLLVCANAARFTRDPRISPQGISPVEPQTFSCLRALSLRPINMEYANQFLTAMPHLHLESFAMTCWETDSGHDWSSLAYAIERTCEHASLRSLYVDEDAEYDVERLAAAGETSEWPRALNLALIQRLAVFTKLASLNLTCWGGFLLNDVGLSDLAQAWPRLEVLALQTKRVMRPVECTVRVLVAFARYCPRIRHFGLDFDAGSFTYDPQVTRGIRQGALKSLDVQRSPIKSAHVVAAFISSLFPGLDAISAADNTMDPEVDDPEGEDLDEEVERKRALKWKRVEQLLPLLRIVSAEAHIEGASTTDAEHAAAMVLADEDYDTDYTDV